MTSAVTWTDLVSFKIKEKVGPVWIGLHVLELKELPQAQDQNLLTNLTGKKIKHQGVLAQWRQDRWVSARSLVPRS